MAETATTNTQAAQAAAESTAAEQQTNATASVQMDEQTLLNNDRVKALIQSAVDREKNKIGNENKQLKKQLEALQKEKLTDDEIKDLELKEREKTLADRDKALTEKENRWIAMQAIKEAGLDDGSKDSLAIVDFVIAEDEEHIRERVKAFGALVERITAEKVKAEFKAHGRTPGVGSDTASNAGGQNESVAARMGRNAAQTAQASRAIIDHYIGGK